jgi:mRNA-degrading endonuclease RelE of RelBE toxin-antitoxin system
VAEKTSQSWAIRVSTKAESYFNKLGKPTKAAVKAKLRALSTYANPLRHPDTKALEGPFKGLNRLRVGKYRFIFELLSKERIISVVNIAPRGNAYR